jgi:hypothetical protein
MQLISLFKDLNFLTYQMEASNKEHLCIKHNALGTLNEKVILKWIENKDWAW